MTELELLNSERCDKAREIVGIEWEESGWHFWLENHAEEDEWWVHCMETPDGCEGHHCDTDHESLCLVKEHFRVWLRERGCGAVLLYDDTLGNVAKRIFPRKNLIERLFDKEKTYWAWAYFDAPYHGHHPTELEAMLAAIESVQEPAKVNEDA